MDFSFRPVKISTDFPESCACTTCPPVTLENVALVRRVGRNWAVVVKEEAGKVPFRTW